MGRIVGYFPQTLRPIVYALQNLDRNLSALGSDMRNKIYIGAHLQFLP